MAVRSDPKYDTDEVSLGYLKKVIAELKEINSTTQDTLEKVFSKNYGSQPTTPYHSGDTWTTEDYIYRCIKDRLVGPFSIDDWVIIYDRKQRELINDNFLFLSQVDIKEQPDGYIETFYLTEDPSFSWDTSLLKSAHEGDFWRTKTEAGFCDYVYTKLATNPVSYDWIETNVPITIFNAITGTKKIYLVEPTNYSVGDLWQKIENSKKVYYETSKDSESFNVDDWKIITEELSLKNLESYYIITSEINKELEIIELNINKKIVESSNSILVAVESDYTKKETTDLLTQKVDANGDSIEAIYGDRTIEIPIKTLSELSIGQKELNMGVSEVAVKTSELERSIQYFACELELYNLTLPSTVDGYLLEDNIYTINHYSYYKGQQVDVIPTLKKSIDGLVITTTDTIIQIEASKDVKISELNNILEFSFNYKDGDQENILIKKLSVSLALQGKTGASGQDGKDGTGVNILGSFETFEELQQAHPTGAMGDAYLIQGNLYVWNGSSWENVGNIQGPKGDQGEQGLRGLQGPQGERGIAGKDGTDGKTTYFHIKYSDVENPTNSSQLLELPSDYIGTYIDFVEDDSTNPQDYTWARFKGIQGETGEQGIPGQNGENGQTSYLHIKYSDDSGKTFTSNNGETVGDYIGQYTDFTEEDSVDVSKYKWSKIKGETGDQGPQGIQGQKGENGESTYFYVRYSVNSSGVPMTETPTPKTEYMGVSSTTSPTAPTSSAAYTWTKIKGDQGEQGTAGKNGENGQTTYLHIKYSEDGLNFTPADEDYGLGEKPSAWIGQYVDYVEEDSSNFDDYKWYKFTEDIDDTLNEIQNELLNQKAIDESEGTNLTLKNSAGLNTVDFRIDGNSHQETRSGKNLIQNNLSDTTKNGITYVINQDKSITGNGTATADSILVPQTYVESELYKAGTYTLSIGNAMPNDESFVRLEFSVDKTSVIQAFNIYGTTAKDIVLTLKQDAYLKVSILFYKDTTLSDFTLNLMLEEGTKATEYEPYGVSPSPDYPSEVEVVEGYNLAKTINIPNNDIITVDNDGVINLSNNPQSSGYCETKITLSTLAPNLKVGDVAYLYLETTYSRKRIYINGGTTWNDGTSKTITQTMLDNMVIIYGGYDKTDVIKIVIAKSNVRKFYVPYKHIGIENVGKNYLNVPSQYELTGYEEIKANIPKGNYIINWDTITTTGTDKGMLLVFFYEDGTEFHKAVWTNTGENFTNIIITKRVIKVNVYSQMSWANSQNATTIFNNLMISADGGEYEPYKEQITYLDLKDEFIGKLPNGTQDYLTVDNQGNYGIQKRVGKVVLNGSENWYISTFAENKYYFSYKPNLNQQIINGKNFICSHFMPKNRWSEQIVGMWFDQNMIITTVGSLDGTQTLEDFKTWLSENNVTVYYELAEPYFVSLGKTPIKTLEDYSTMHLLSTLDTNMYCKYIRNVDSIDAFQTKEDMGNYYNRFETDAQISIQKDEILEQVSDVRTLVDENGKTLAGLEQSVTERITSTEAQIQVINNKLENGVETVKNTLVTVDIEGIKVAKNTSKVSSLIANNQFVVKDSLGKNLTFIGYDEEEKKSKAEMDNLSVSNYFTAGYHRQEKMRNLKRTGWYYVGGSK